MQLLHTLLLAFSVVGAQRRQTAPKMEARTGDACLMVEAPQDILMKVFYRAQTKLKEVQPKMRLQWLQTRIDGEIEAWVDKVRNTSGSLGEIVRDVYDKREAIWHVEEACRMGREEPQTPARKTAQPSSSSPKPTQNASSPKQGGEKPKVGTATQWAKELQNGRKLCQAFQRKKCSKGAKCNDGAHLCAGVQTNGRICGLPHPAMQCINKKVTRE